MSGYRNRLSSAHVMSAAALAIALGGSAYAASEVSKNSVDSASVANGTLKSTDLKNEATKGVDLKDGTVGNADVTDQSLTGTDVADESLAGADVLDGGLTGAEIANDGLSGGDIDEPSLGEVPAAALADDAGLLGGQPASAFQRRGSVTACPGTQKATALGENGNVACAADLGAPGIRIETSPTDLTPDVTGLTVLLYHVGVPTVLGDVGPPRVFDGGVDGQRLTVVSRNAQVILSEDANTILVGAGWTGDNGDTLTLVRADGVWYETSRSAN